MTDQAQGAVGAETMTAEWRCPECGCHSYAHVQEQKTDGSFGPGPKIRCVNCKAVWMHKSTLASPRADSDGRTAGVELIAWLKREVRENREEASQSADNGDFYRANHFFAKATALEEALDLLSQTTPASACTGDVSTDLVEAAARAIFEADEDLNDRQVYEMRLAGKHVAADALTGPRARWDDPKNAPILDAFRYRAKKAIEAARCATPSATPAQPAGAVPDSLREAYEAADLHECWVNGDTADVVTNPYPGCGNFDQIVARCATGDLWRKRAVAIAESLNFVRALLASHPGGQSAGSGAECPTCDGSGRTWVPIDGEVTCPGCGYPNSPHYKPSPDSTRTGQGEAEELNRRATAMIRQCFARAEIPEEISKDTLRAAAFLIGDLEAVIFAARPAAPEAQGAERLQHLIDLDDLACAKATKAAASLSSDRDTYTDGYQNGIIQMAGWVRSAIRQAVPSFDAEVATFPAAPVSSGQEG